MEDNWSRSEPTLVREIENSINQYLTALDTADRQEPEVAQLRTLRLQDKIAALKKQMQALKEIEVQLKNAPDGQISLTDPDSRSMKTRGTGMVGYNVQTAVDAKHHIIVEHEVIRRCIFSLPPDFSSGCATSVVQPSSFRTHLGGDRGAYLPLSDLPFLLRSPTPISRLLFSRKSIAESMHDANGCLLCTYHF